MNKKAVKVSRTAMYATIAKTKSATQRLKIICSMPLSRNILWDFHGELLKEIDHDQDMFKKQREALKRIQVVFCDGAALVRHAGMSGSSMCPFCRH
jgi:hypothetical protein